ncbi:hypothetical protein Hanom_Chr09g00794451 [Helianthus anomalus]
MLLNGSPLVPFRFLVLNNIWISRNSGERKIIPHCRFIAALLKLYGAIGAEIGVDARPLQPGEADEPKSGDEVPSGDEDYREDAFNVDVEMGGAGPSGGVQRGGTQSGYVGRAFDYAQ